MCEYCLQSKCPPPCPNFESENRVVGTCSVCGQEIYDNEYVYRVSDDEAIHCDCAERFTLEEIFDLQDINVDRPVLSTGVSIRELYNAVGVNISQSFRNQDIDAETVFENLNIEKLRAEY